MKINILLPHKEQFDKNNLSSVSITVLNNFNHSKFKKQIRIFGKKVKEPATPHNFIGIKNSLNIFKSKNLHLAKMMCISINKDSDNDQLVEIHNRPKLLNFIIKKIKIKYPVNIFFHNNPLDMAGSKTLFERKMIVNNAHAIFCVSKYVKNKFLVGFNFTPSNIHVLYNGIERKYAHFPQKKNEILFVGRLVKEKGINLFVDALENVALKLPNWKFCIVGSSHLGTNKKMSSFAKKYSKKFLDIGKQASFTGYLSHSKVQKKMKGASIVVVPSLWEEPFGLVVAEAMSNGAAIIASCSGGIPEIISNNGILIKEINNKKLENAILSIASDKKSQDKYQQLSWRNFKHTAIESSKKLDDFRVKTFKDHSK